MRQVLKAIGTCIAKGTVRIFGTCVLNTIIVEFMISNCDIIVTENEIGENNPKPSLGIYSRRRVKGEDIFSIYNIYSNFVIVEDLRREMKHFEIAKTY
jgi:hypothetical protein